VNVATFVAALYVTVPVTLMRVAVVLTVTFPAAVIVAAFIASLKVMFTGEVTATLVAPLTGDTESTVGGTLSTLMNAQTKFDASAFPETSFAPVVIVAVYVVPEASAGDGVNVAVFVAALYATAPATAALVAVTLTVNVLVVSVVASIALLNVALITAFVGTFVARLAGEVDTTVGAVVSLVVKLNWTFAPIAFPATSLTADDTTAV
jgi:hypothetical protein